MHRMLVVDDEAPIADGLCEVFQGLARLDLDVYKAYSGVDAMRLLRTARIDLVVTDIRMPGMDGLELLKEIHARWPKCRVLILSGYSEFEYVYTAIRYEGVSYLLKAEGYDAVIDAVEQALAEIDGEIKAESLIEAANEQMDKAKALMRENYLTGILKGRYGAHDIDGGEFLDMDIPLRADRPVILLVGRVEGMPKDLPHSEKFRKLYGIRAIADRYMPPQSVSVCVTDETAHLIWLIQPIFGPEGDGDPAAWQACATYVKGDAELIQTASFEALGMALSLSLDDVPARWIELPERLANLKMLLNYRIGRESGMLLTGKIMIERMARPKIAGAGCLLGTNKPEPARAEDRALATSMGPAMIRSLLEQLAELLEYGNEGEYFDCMEKLGSGLYSIGSIRDFPALELYYGIATVLLSYINRWSLIERVATEIALYRLMAAESHDSLREAVAYLRRLGEILIGMRESDRELRATDTVGAIQRHISDNICKPDEQSLVRLADLIHLNPSYLSRFYKQATGMNLSDYIAEARVRKAKSLLENEGMRIHEVAEALGYGTATNFARFFKKLTNLTPQEYRDLRQPE